MEFGELDTCPMQPPQMPDALEGTDHTEGASVVSEVSVESVVQRTCAEIDEPVGEQAIEGWLRAIAIRPDDQSGVVFSVRDLQRGGKTRESHLR